MSKKESILLALDESPFLMLVQRALHAAGYETAEAHDHAGLERILQETSPSLLLIGNSFHNESGLTLAAIQLERFPTLPILLYVEKDSGEIAKSVLTAGLSGYLFPPLRTEDIVAAVERSLARARHIGDWVRHEVKRTTSTLQRQVHDMDAIFQNLGDGVIILDKHNRILLINQSIQKAFKVDSKAVTGVSLDEAIPNPDLLSLLNHSTTEETKVQEISLDDERVYMARSTAIPGIGSAITMQDISYLKELERVKNDFVHTVSHDLRSPLTSVLGYAELVGRTGPLNDDQRDFLSRLQGSVQQITALVNDLLDIRRMEAGFDTRRETVHLGTILDQTLNMLLGQIQAKHLHVQLTKDSTIPPLKANPLRLRQMLDNLLGNAIKYTEASGTIGINLHNEGGQVILSITDSGPGISPADQPHIFEKFYRGENIPDGVIGSGLGLAIVKSIVDNHQGRIWVESTLGKGTTFFVVLPAETSS